MSFWAQLGWIWGIETPILVLCFSLEKIVYWFDDFLYKWKEKKHKKKFPFYDDPDWKDGWEEVEKICKEVYDPWGEEDLYFSDRKVYGGVER